MNYRLRVFSKLCVNLKKIKSYQEKSYPNLFDLIPWISLKYLIDVTFENENNEN